MALANRPSSLARPDLIIIEYRFLIHCMEKGIRKLQLKIDRDPTVASQVMALANRPPAWLDQTSSSSSIDSSSTQWKRASGNSSKSLIAIQRSDRKLWPLRTVHPAWLDQTSSSPSMDSLPTPWKRASGKSSKSLIAIQRSDRKLWPLRNVHPVWHDQISSSPSIDSSSTPWKRASGNSS